MGGMQRKGRTRGARWRTHTPSSWATVTQAERWRWHKETRQWLKQPGNTRCTIGLPGCTTTATTVDHIDGCDYRTQRFDRRYWRPACTPCHRKRTSQQGHAAQARARTHKPTQDQHSHIVTPKPSRQWLR